MFYPLPTGGVWRRSHPHARAVNLERKMCEAINCCWWGGGSFFYQFQRLRGGIAATSADGHKKAKKGDDSPPPKKGRRRKRKYGAGRGNYSVKVRTDVITTIIITISSDTSSESSSSSFSRWLTDRQTEEGGTKQWVRRCRTSTTEGGELHLSAGGWERRGRGEPGGEGPRSVRDSEKVKVLEATLRRTRGTGDNFEFPIQLIRTSLDRRRKLDNPERTHADTEENMQTPHKKDTENVFRLPASYTSALRELLQNNMKQDLFTVLIRKQIKTQNILIITCLSGKVNIE